MVMKVWFRARRLSLKSLLIWLSVIGIIILGVGPSIPVAAQQPTTTTVANPIPMFAYYYIWFDSNSWNRAKIDYPLLGRYTSDDRTVMRQHILWAKAAGITGFIVSWKSTDVLNRRLDQLEQVAEEENFKLAVIYEALDFNRNPLPVSQIASDLDYFIKQFSGRKAFQIFTKPVVIWSGTWKYTPQQISQVVEPRRSSIMILASERTVQGVQRLSGMVDGDAYYWSSVNPDTFPNYQDKLTAMGTAVHQEGGLWIPPAAPGFNATAIGGTSTVNRKNGDTFITQINTAMASSPDVLGIISWNEFSENSYIEPSQLYGSQYLDLLSQINHLSIPNTGLFDSSEPTTTYPDVLPAIRYIALGSFVLLVVLAILILARRYSAGSKRRHDQ